ncbi:MAG TPA: hypothetical protein VKV41_25005 [Methylomirabilota bacterium]|jgi:hypothetical protein|nr:hypothetical protein [Methylomirabilota bacterium]
MAKRRKAPPRPRADTATCAPGVCNPRRTQGLKAPAPAGTFVLMNLQGPGVFLGAEVSKQGGTNDLTFVILDIDGANVTNMSYAAARNLGLLQQNPFGLVLLQSALVKTMTIGFPTPLRFARSLRLSVKVSEPTVVQILANVITGSV